MQSGGPAIASRDPDLALLDGAIDHAYYRALAGPEAGADLAAHFHAHGWRQGLNPCAWFDCAWYLRSFPDIAAAGIDPFLHYLAHGAREGRAARAPAGALAGLLAAAIAPGDRRPGYDAPADAPLLGAAALGHALLDALQGAAGLVVSLSHDRYIDVTGGMQVLIAEEARLFAAGAVTYVHLSPAVSRLTLGGAGEGFAQLQVVLRGRFIGLCGDAEFAAVLAAALASGPRDLPKALVVHSVFGHRTAAILRLAAAMAGAGRLAHHFWLHDYASLCEGFTLLRNDLEHCHAPPPGSMACRICIHGASRPDYLAELGTLFAALPFHVAAPSRAALDIWLRATRLPWLSARVHGNALLADPRPLPPRGRRGSLGDPVRVAFAGYPLPHKGWPAFLELLHRLAGRPEYRLHHFAAADTLPPMDGLVSVPARVTVADRTAMARALEAQQIDLLLLLSPWPETFSYVAHEGLAAGADLVTLEAGGNVPDLVRGLQRGVVLADLAGLLAYFTSGAAIADVHAREAAGRSAATLLASGATATLELSSPAPADPRRWVTEQPGLVALVDGAPLPLGPESGWLAAALPAGAVLLRLRSRMAPPGPAGAGAGLVLAALALDGAMLAPGDARLLSGWLDGRLATDGDALLRLDGAAHIALRPDPAARYWQAPMTRLDVAGAPRPVVALAAPAAAG